MDIRIVNEIPMSAQELWKILGTPEFDAFVAREYELKEYTEIERSVTESLTKRRVRIVSGTELSYIPRGLAHKILRSDRVVYEEIQYKYNHRYEMRWSGRWIEPSLLKHNLRGGGRLQLIPIDGDRCSRIREIRLHIDLFAIGPVLEGMAAEQAKKTSGKFSRVVAKWKARSRL